MESQHEGIKVYTARRKIEANILTEKERRMAEMECVVEAPERISWHMQINDASISGEKVMQAGEKVRLVFDISLEKEEIILGSTPER